MSNRYLTKIAAALQKHQEEGLAQLEKRKGVIFHHSMGSGKTLTALTAIQRDQKQNPHSRTLLVAPASLVSNFEKEMKKHGIKIDMSKVDLHSYEGATNNAEELKKREYSLAVADEIQKLRNTGTKRTQALSEIISKAKKRALMTGTLQFNASSDIAPVLNMAAGKRVIPEDKKTFNERYIRTVENKPTLIQRILGQNPGERVSLKNQEELKGILNKHVHFYDTKDDPKNAKHFPTVSEKNVEVEMSKEQQKYYKYLEGDIPILTRYKIRQNLPLDAKEKMNLNAFSTGVRMASNSTRHLHKNPDSVAYTPKIEKAVANLKKKLKEDPNFRGMAYSTYLHAGASEYSRKLTEEGIPHVMYTGQMSAAEKDQAIKDYNEGRVPVLIVSSSGAEGLNLKGTKLVQLLEGHYNKSKLAQVKARAARFQSHSHLPENERHVEIENYHSVHPKPLIGKAHMSIDQYLHQNASDKDVLFEQVKGLMRK